MKLAAIAVLLFVTSMAPSIASAQAVTAPATASPADHAATYKLGPYDKISVKVFGEEKLSVSRMEIDAGGQINLPLIGVMMAGGKTATELADDIARQLGEKYLQSPHVNVLIDEALSDRVTVSGAVVESGVYMLKGHTTLNQAIALAKGPDTKIANLKHVAIFRQVNGMNTRAVFDLKAIRAGAAPDPEVYGGDSIIVEGSGGREFWRELVSALPALGVFAYF